MSLSLYDATIPSFLQQLRALDGVIGKAQDHCASGAISEDELQAARLADDMLPFVWQVSGGPGHSLGAIEGCQAGVYSPNTNPPPATFAEQRTKIGDTIAALAALTPESVNALADQDVLFSVPAYNMAIPFVGADFLLSFALPNFYFHVTTAYDLLRMKGVAIGKLDFLGALRSKGQ